jgi:hypothetical protein
LLALLLLLAPLLLLAALLLLTSMLLRHDVPAIVLDVPAIFNVLLPLASQ